MRGRSNSLRRARMPRRRASATAPSRARQERTEACAAASASRGRPSHGASVASSCREPRAGAARPRLAGRACCSVAFHTEVPDLQPASRRTRCVPISVDNGCVRRSSDRKQRRGSVGLAECLRPVAEVLSDREPRRVRLRAEPRGRDGVAPDRCGRSWACDLVAREVAGGLGGSWPGQLQTVLGPSSSVDNELVGLDPARGRRCAGLPRRARGSPTDRVEEPFLPVGGVEPGAGELDGRLNDGPRNAAACSTPPQSPATSPGTTTKASMEGLVGTPSPKSSTRFSSVSPSSRDGAARTMDARPPPPARPGEQKPPPVGPVGEPRRRRGLETHSYDAGVDHIARVREHAHTCLHHDLIPGTMAACMKFR